jgi:hypothetical protein
MTVSRNCDQLEGSLSRRVLPFQLSDTLVPCVSHFITFIFIKSNTTPQRVSLVNIVTQLSKL